ncbi:hypothetical protein ACHAXA_000300 [Cyclostephanos tholiformis]|uniref:Uncharacterized protein n=1 Tax=Cyclostephanos tholiformis TaxID=382380 RepID=A0ABD3RRQ5_9STRA
MAQRPAGMSTPTAYRQEDLVRAMITQLREKDLELTRHSKHCQVLLEKQKISDQTHLLLHGKIDSYQEEMSKMEAKITVLEEESLKHRLENIAESAKCKRVIQERDRVIQERDDELSQLRPIVEELKMRIHKYEDDENSRKPSKLELEVTKVNEDLSIARNEILKSHNTIDQLEKKIRSKEWVIKTLKEENDEQRSRETQLLAQINKMNESIDTYETEFIGKGVDVPMLIAKLKDHEARTKELEGQVSRLTNKKLNELVLRSALGPLQETKGKPNTSKSLISRYKPNSPRPKSPQSCNSHRWDGADEVLTENSFNIGNSTLFSHGTDETEDRSFIDEDGMFDDFMSDVENGIDFKDGTPLLFPKVIPSGDCIPHQGSS